MTIPFGVTSIGTHAFNSCTGLTSVTVPASVTSIGGTLISEAGQPCTELTNWTTAGVTQSAPGPDGRSTATIPLNAPHRFLRLTVED